jgi:hypothetical protein
MRTDGSTLELVDRSGRVKYYLAGRVVTGGDPVDLCFSGGWVTGRYEWSGDVSERPSFHYSLELMAEGRVAQGIIEIPEGAVLRWPEPSAF